MAAMMFVDHQRCLWQEPSPLHQTAQGVSAAIHIGLGEDQQQVLALRRSSVALHAVEGQTPTGSYGFNDPKTNVVAGPPIALAGIAETHEHPRRRRLGWVGRFCSHWGKLAFVPFGGFPTDDLGLRRADLQKVLFPFFLFLHHSSVSHGSDHPIFIRYQGDVLGQG